jgi:hypothetical protein
LDDRDLMEIRADTLFRHDLRGRMVCVNDPEGRPAPRLFLGQTGGGSVVRFGPGVSDTLARALTEIIEHEPTTGDQGLEPTRLEAIRKLLVEDAPITVEGGGPAYRFSDSMTPHGVAFRVTAANLDLVRDTYPWLLRRLADCEPCFALVRDGAAVSICHSSRNGTAAAEAGVNTLPAFRGRGYATVATLAWGTTIRSSGRMPLYSTAWDNVASQGVARRAGLVMFGADQTWW